MVQKNSPKNNPKVQGSNGPVHILPYASLILSQCDKCRHFCNESKLHEELLNIKFVFAKFRRTFSLSDIKGHTALSIIPTIRSL